MSEGPTAGSQPEPQPEPTPALPLGRPPVAPRTVLIGAAAWLLLAWGVVVASDGLDLFGWQAHLREPLWQTLFFNRRPTEWLQWLSLGATYGGGLYLAARIRHVGHVPVTRFLVWFGVGAGLMLVEDAGDVRHVLALYARRVVDDGLVLGLHPATLVDLPYFTALALPLLYALARYGRPVCQAVPQARPHLVLAYGAYGLAAVGSALSGVGGGRHEESVYLGSLYERMGGTLVRLLPGDEWMMGTLDPAHFRFQVMDAPVEESLELLGAAGMVALVLAIGQAFSGTSHHTSPDGEPG